MLAFSFGNTVVLQASWVSLVAIFIPFITALVVRFNDDHNRIHALVALLLAAALAVVRALTDGLPNDTVVSLFTVFLSTLLPSLGAYYSFWKPVTQINARALPNVGLPGARIDTPPDISRLTFPEVDDKGHPRSYNPPV